MHKTGKYLMAALWGACAGAAAVKKATRTVFQKKEEETIKFHEFYSILIQWVHMHNDGKEIGVYLKKLGYHTVAIYGMKELGEELLYELKNSEVEVKYAIDKNASDLWAEIDIYRPDEELEPVDAVLVTAIHWFDEIEKELKKKLDCPILSLEDIVYDA